MNKRATVILLIISSVLLFSGCLPISVNPVHTKDQVLTDSSLVGKWVVRDEGEIKEVVRLSFHDSVTYKVQYSEADGEMVASYLGQLTRIKDDYVMSIRADLKSIVDTTDIAQLMFLHGFFFIKLDKISSEKIQVSFLDVDWIREFLEEGDSGVKSVRIGDDMIIADSPENTRKFIGRCFRIQESMDENRQVYEKVES